ncbi:MAG: ComEC/Rec2 family competence protein [Verrucomicrobiota bacterium]
MTSTGKGMDAPLFIPSLAFLGGVLFSLFLGPLDLIYFLIGLALILWGEFRGFQWVRYRWIILMIVGGMAYGLIRSKDSDLDGSQSYFQSQGVICSEVKATGHSQVFDCEFLEKEKGLKSQQIKLLVTTEDPRHFEWGDRVKIRGTREGFHLPRNPGEFNEESWHRLRGVEGRLLAEEIQIIQENDSLVIGKELLKFREKAKQLLGMGFFWGTKERALIQGMILGDTSEMSSEMKDDFRSTGTGHIFAVSGQNLGVILVMMVAVMRFLHVNSWRWGWISLVPLLFYSGLTGFQSSCMRAWIMVGLLVIAWRIDRPAPWSNLWAVTLLLVLLNNPGAVRDLGYQLSFLVVLGLIFMTPLGMDHLKGYWQWEPFLSKTYATPFQFLSFQWRKSICSLGVGSAVAFISVLPHSIFVFHQINLLSILLNLGVVPLAGVIVVVGTVSLLLGMIHPFLSQIMNMAGYALAKLLLFLVQAVASIHCFQMPVADIHTWRWDRSPQMVILDCGDVPLALLRYHHEVWMINSGSSRNYERTIHPLLKYYGIRQLDGVIASTISASSNGGLETLLKDYPVRHLIRPDLKSLAPLEHQWKTIVGEKAFQSWKEEDGYVWDQDFQVKVLPRSDSMESKGSEDRGIELDFEYHGKHLLWTNRISHQKEDDFILKNNLPSPIEVLIQGRNPRMPNLSEEWIQALNPNTLIVPRTGKGIQRTGYDPAWDLGKRTKGKVFYLDQTGALILNWKERITIEPWNRR